MCLDQIILYNYYINKVFTILILVDIIILCYNHSIHYDKSFLDGCSYTRAVTIVHMYIHVCIYV